MAETDSGVMSVSLSPPGLCCRGLPVTHLRFRQFVGNCCPNRYLSNNNNNNKNIIVVILISAITFML